MINTLLFAALVLQAEPDTSHAFRLGLRQAMDAARKDAFQAETARSQARESQAKTAESRSALLPHVGASASHVVRSFDLPAFGFALPVAPGAEPLPNLVKPFGAQDARINGRIALFDGPAWLRYQAAKYEMGKGKFEAQATEENVALAAAEAYCALARDRALLASRKSELALARQLSDLTQAQKQAGAATQIEVLRADGQVSAAQSALTLASEGEEQARYVLLRILGLPLDAYPVLTDSLAIKDAADVSPGTGGQESGPEIAAADMDKRSALVARKAIKAAYLPSLELAGDYGLSGRKLNSRAEWTETIALQLNWNLWDGGGREARMHELAERAHQADLRARDARLASDEDARVSRSAMTASREAAGFALDRVRLAEQEEALARERFQSGGSGNLEVISAQGSVSLAHQAYIDALYAYNRAWLEYLKASNRLAEI
jgi:outer membrane protein TolC